MDTFFQIFILIFSVIIHEISHGLAALAFGDRTAEYEGRLTLNPIKHIDPWGSVIIPIFLSMTGTGFMIGWAKPVPYNPYNLRNRKIAEPLVALAGPLSNLLVATIFGILMRVLVYSGMATNPLFLIFKFIVILNIGLAVFNLAPIPPLDGSKVLFASLPVAGKFVFSSFAQRYGLLLIIGFMIFLPNIIWPIMTKIFFIITGSVF